MFSHIVVDKPWHDSATTQKDWENIKFGVEDGVDFYDVSFVKDANVIHELKDFRKSNVSVIYGSLGNL